MIPHSIVYAESVYMYTHDEFPSGFDKSIVRAALPFFLLAVNKVYTALSKGLVF